MMKLRQCVETWVSQENGHFSLNNGSNSSWIRNSAISYEKKNKKLYRHPLVDINNINVPGQRICSHFLVQIPRADGEIVTNKLLLIFWVSQENGHFSLNNGSNSSWIRNSAISYEKKNISLICIQIPENVK
jgi:uncharacterized protein (DUF779 family)